MNYYTADLHFSHQAIIRHCNRPFNTADEMDAALIATLQQTVQRHDHLWILGDLFFTRAKTDIQALFEKIPGQKHLVTGNHDDKRVKKLSWASVRDMGVVKDGDQKFYVCHYPMITWPGSRYGAIHLFGHVHNNWSGCNRSVNVGVDLWDFKPATAAQITQRAKTHPKNPLWSTLEPGT